MKENSVKKMEELMTDKEFVQRIASAGSYEKAYQLCVERGMDCSFEEFTEEIRKAEIDLITSGLISEDGEISEELMVAVSGGRNRAGAIQNFAKSAAYAVRGDALRSGFHYLVGVVCCLW